jgi:glycosyltransferase involved in cell wall biosynthesis
LFSIIIPLFNKKHFIERAISSVINQSFKKFEIIVVNDGSDDGSDDLVKEKFKGQVHLIDQKNQGVSVARNTGIQAAKYDYIAFLDADDLWAPDFLLEISNAIIKHPNEGLLGTGYTWINEGKSIEDLTKNLKEEIYHKRYSASEYFKQAFLSNLIWTSAIVMKKEFFTKYEGFDSKIKFGEDIDVWYRAILHFGGLLFIPKVLAYYSKEDNAAATKRNYFLHQTLIPKILDEDYFPWEDVFQEESIQAFDHFKVKWVYLRLVPAFKLKENKAEIKKVLKRINGKFFWMGIPYSFPFEALNYILNKKSFSNQLNKYILYCGSKFYM